MAALVFIPMSMCLLFFFTGIFVDHKKMTIWGYGSVMIVLMVLYLMVATLVWIPLFDLYRGT
jgi:hypothetical protein